jgi:type IV pilus assembly protein PilV
MSAMNSNRTRSQQGLSMIEVLVSLTIVAFGLLGLAGLQARSMTFHKDSIDRKAAAEIAAQLGERLRANYDGYRQGHYNNTLAWNAQTPVAIPVCQTPDNCTPQEVAARDLAMLHIDMRRRLPVSGAYLTAPAGSVAMTMTLAWQEGGVTDGNVDPVCFQVGIVDISFRCMQWLIHP